MANKIDRLPVHSQVVRIHHSAGKQQRVVIVRLRAFQLPIDLHIFSPILLIPGPNGPGVWGNHFSLCASLVESLLRLQKLRLLEPVGGEDGDSFSLYVFWRSDPPSNHINQIGRIERSLHTCPTPYAVSRYALLLTIYGYFI